MPACANCARELRPEWKFCVSCGMPTGVTAARPETKAIPIIAAVAPQPVARSIPEPVPVRETEPALDPEPVREPEPVLVAEPARAPEPALVATAAAPAAPAAAPAPAPAPTLLVAPPEPAPATAPVSIRTRPDRTASRRRVNALAIVALVLGCLASPLAALFGHLALSQLSASGERGRLPALVAIVLGYGSLVFIVGLCLIYLTSHA